MSMTDFDGVRLVVSMLVKNEEHRYLEQVLFSMLQWADEIRLVDDSSTDGTARVAEGVSYKVRVKSLMGGSYWEMAGEGRARQVALEWAVEAGPTHILHLDADEFVSDGRRLRRLLASTSDMDVFGLRMVEVWDRSSSPWQIRVDGQWPPRLVPVCWRVPRLTPGISGRPELPPGYEIPDRRLASGREPEIVGVLGAAGDMLDTGVDVVHLGWSDPGERRGRFDRYMQVDGGKHHAQEHLLSIMEHPVLEPYPSHPEIAP